MNENVEKDAMIELLDGLVSTFKKSQELNQKIVAEQAKPDTEYAKAILAFQEAQKAYQESTKDLPLMAELLETNKSLNTTVESHREQIIAHRAELEALKEQYGLRYQILEDILKNPKMQDYANLTKQSN